MELVDGSDVNGLNGLCEKSASNLKLPCQGDDNKSFIRLTSRITLLLPVLPLQARHSSRNNNMADADEDVIPRGGQPGGEDVDLSDEPQDFRFLSSIS